MTPEIAWQDEAPAFAQGLAILYGEAFRGGVAPPPSVWEFGDVVAMVAASVQVPAMVSAAYAVPGMDAAAFGVPLMTSPAFGIAGMNSAAFGWPAMVNPAWSN